MDYLYSLYDALVSINVPNDKARAVVDAMERDMTTTIATKTDLQLVKQELLTKMAELPTRAEIEAIRDDISRTTFGLGAGMVGVIGLLFLALKYAP